jgi:hypothetical protein
MFKNNRNTVSHFNPAASNNAFGVPQQIMATRANFMAKETKHKKASRSVKPKI